MSLNISVFNIDKIKCAGEDLNKVRANTFDMCDKGVNQAKELLEKTQEEEQISKYMLDTAKGIEIVKKTILTELEIRLAAATAELAAAPDPISKAISLAKIAEINSQLIPAQQEYMQAVRHREALERRHKMAIQAMNIAKDRLDTLQIHFEINKRSIDVIVDNGCARLNYAYQDLERYVSRVSPKVIKTFDKWFNDTPKENTPVKPNEIRDKLEVDENIIEAVLEYLYATDLGFRTNVNNYCEEMKLGNELSAELKIKKQMVGRLSEEIVIRAFKPISTQINTQKKESLPDGRYTKVDLVVYGLKNPLILGRGEGMGAREGGSLAVEVKSGHCSYLYQQLNHMRLQAIGHKECDASCVICTRDIRDLSPEKESELRESLRKAGSPIIGMLPKKDELDIQCINFVKGKLKNV